MDSAKEQTPTPEFAFPDNGGRPILRKGSLVRTQVNSLSNLPNSDKRPSFRPNDQVLFYSPELREWTGPFFVSYVEDGRYKLCNEQQQEVNGGQWVEETALKLFDPFE